MAFPEFFAQAPSIKMHDGLAETLGASDDGTIEYHYADAVRVAGHSCPTVAGAWLMARAALKALYGNQPAERGNVEVTMSGDENEGTNGVMAQVFTLVTGAAADNGFHGLGGRYVRRDLLRYNGGDGHAIAHFRRRDTGVEVGVTMDFSAVPPRPEMRTLMGRALAPDATGDERRAFGAVWQERVQRILLQHADDANAVQVQHYA